MPSRKHVQLSYVIHTRARKADYAPTIPSPIINTLQGECHSEYEFNTSGLVELATFIPNPQVSKSLTEAGFPKSNEQNVLPKAKQICTGMDELGKLLSNIIRNNLEIILNPLTISPTHKPEGGSLIEFRVGSEYMSFAITTHDNLTNALKVINSKLERMKAEGIIAARVEAMAVAAQTPMLFSNTATKPEVGKIATLPKEPAFVPLKLEWDYYQAEGLEYAKGAKLDWVAGLMQQSTQSMLQINMHTDNYIMARELPAECNNNEILALYQDNIWTPPTRGMHNIDDGVYGTLINTVQAMFSDLVRCDGKIIARPNETSNLRLQIGSDTYGFLITDKLSCIAAMRQLRTLLPPLSVYDITQHKDLVFIDLLKKYTQSAVELADWTEVDQDQTARSASPTSKAALALV
jgi:hypothetical protein